MIRLRNVAAAVLLGSLGASSAADAKDRFWVLWERYEHVGENCPNGAECKIRREFTSRLLNTVNVANLYRLFGVLDPHDPSGVAPSPNPLAPTICDAGQAEISLGFDPLDLPQSIKVEALRGIEALYVDLRPLEAPPGFTSEFGGDLHGKFVQILQRGGIRVLDKNAISKIPGQPKLNIYFSHTDPDGACDYEYSVFASLSQEVLLARNMRIKITAGVWSYSTSSIAKDHTGTEKDAILRVADAFVRDHQAVNPK